MTLASDGFAVLPVDRRVADWAVAALEVATTVAADPVQQARWLRHDGTWFVGVDALPNADDGSVKRVPLAGPWGGLIDAVPPLHPAQLSVVYPGYPRRAEDETETAHRFRLTRDAAHLDGLLAEGAGKRRFLREPHRWILGLPLNPSDASPLVVWRHSHVMVRRAFQQAYEGVDPQKWGDTDVTEVYQAVRKAVFDTCDRVIVRAVPGQAIVVHRHAIHGVAPWADDAKAPPEGRMVAYFRPHFADPADWLRQP